MKFKITYNSLIKYLNIEKRKKLLKILNNQLGGTNQESYSDDESDYEESKDDIKKNIRESIGEKDKIESKKNDKEKKEELIVKLKNALICPISENLMIEPVFGSDGYSYEKEYIEKWLETNNISPMTGQRMKIQDLIPNRSLKNLIKLIIYEGMLDLDATKEYLNGNNEALFDIIKKKINNKNINLFEIPDDFNEISIESIIYDYNYEQNKTTKNILIQLNNGKNLLMSQDDIYIEDSIFKDNIITIQNKIRSQKIPPGYRFLIDLAKHTKNMNFGLEITILENQNYITEEWFTTSDKNGNILKKIRRSEYDEVKKKRRSEYDLEYDEVKKEFKNIKDLFEEIIKLHNSYNNQLNEGSISTSSSKNQIKQDKFNKSNLQLEKFTISEPNNDDISELVNNGSKIIIDNKFLYALNILLNLHKNNNESIKKMLLDKLFSENFDEIIKEELINNISFTKNIYYIPKYEFLSIDGEFRKGGTLTANTDNISNAYYKHDELTFTFQWQIGNDNFNFNNIDSNDSGNNKEFTIPFKESYVGKYIRLTAIAKDSRELTTSFESLPKLITNVENEVYYLFLNYKDSMIMKKIKNKFLKTNIDEFPIEDNIELSNNIFYTTNDNFKNISKPEDLLPSKNIIDKLNNNLNICYGIVMDNIPYLNKLVGSYKKGELEVWDYIVDEDVHYKTGDPIWNLGNRRIAVKNNEYKIWNVLKPFVIVFTGESIIERLNLISKYFKDDSIFYAQNFSKKSFINEYSKWEYDSNEIILLGDNKDLNIDFIRQHIKFKEIYECRLINLTNFFDEKNRESFFSTVNPSLSTSTVNPSLSTSKKNSLNYQEYEIPLSKTNIKNISSTLDLKNLKNKFKVDEESSVNLYKKIKNYLDLDENIYLIRCEHYRHYIEYPYDNNRYYYIFYFNSGILITIEWNYEKNISNNIKFILRKYTNSKLNYEYNDEDNDEYNYEDNDEYNYEDNDEDSDEDYDEDSDEDYSDYEYRGQDIEENIEYNYNPGIELIDVKVFKDDNNEMIILSFEKEKKIEILNINNINTEDVIITTNFNEEEIPKFQSF